ncbi:unnamed protein product [Didymodactylos carnosus]|uniref:HAT C-terminal dimerisation domain-containing protein n=2 Tax=Didymodactylos carnosus TaxID=1234261 RepID=A0A8S2WER8_9BILA|nr:unnamed protein product [Didymodactylos carnosus]
MKSHNCIPSTTINEGPLAKYLNNKKATDVQKQDKDQMKQKLTQWICLSVRSFSIVEDCGLNEVIQEAVRIGQKYTNPVNVNDILVRTDSIANHVRCLAEQYRQSLKPILIEQADAGAFCISPDLWSDKYRKISYLSLTCVFIDKNFEFKTIDLCCGEYDELDKTGSSVLSAIRDQLKKFGLEYYFDNKKLSFTSDRGSNIIKALAGQELSFCFGHRINNILKKTFYQTPQKPDKPLQPTPPKCKQKYMNSSEEESSDDEILTKPSPTKHPEAITTISQISIKSKELLETISCSKALVKYLKLVSIKSIHFVELLKQKLFDFICLSSKVGMNKEIQDNYGVALKQSNVTRWLSLSSLLESIEISIEHARSIISSKPAAVKQKVCINKINIEGIKDLVCLLKPFKHVSTLVQTGDRPSLHMVYVAINKLERNNFFRQRLRQLLSTMFSFYNRHLAAALLHPQYCKLTYADDYQRGITHVYVREQIKKMYGNANQQNNQLATTDEPSEKKYKTMEDQFMDPADNDADNNLTTSRSLLDELDKYLKMAIDVQFKQPNPLVFWKDHQQKFPYLAKLARHLYSIPATSAGVERQFSAAGLVINERRLSLNPDTVEDILFVRSIQKSLEKDLHLFS